jgi:hypothetical protein
MQQLIIQHLIQQTAWLVINNHLNKNYLITCLPSFVPPSQWPCRGWNTSDGRMWQIIIYYLLWKFLDWILYILNLCLYALHQLFKINYAVTGFKAWSFYGKGPYPLLWAGSRAACGKSNHYFYGNSQFTNVAAGRITHAGGLHVVNPWFKKWNSRILFLYDTMVCQWVIRSEHIKTTQCPHLQLSFGLLACTDPWWRGDYAASQQHDMMICWHITFQKNGIFCYIVAKTSKPIM